MSRERGENHTGITAENAKEVVSYIERLICEPIEAEPSNLTEITQQAGVIYSSEVSKYEERSPGYNERLRSYEKLGKLVVSAPYVHLFLRILDDHIDGDIECEQDELIAFLKGTARGLKGLETDEERSKEIMPLFEMGFHNWGISTERMQEARKLGLYGMIHMLEDPIRAGNTEIVEEEDLNKFLLHNTGAYFSMFYMALGVEWRAFSPDEDRITTFARRDAELKALMQHLRPDDLEKDWNAGIINIPSEVLVDTARLGTDADFEQVFENSTIREWALEMAGDARRSFLNVGIKGALLVPKNWKASILIPAMTANYWKIMDQVQTVYSAQSDR